MTNLRLRYQTLEFRDADIHLCTLRDREQFNDPLGIAEKLGISSSFWPIFGLLWPSGLVLAHFMDSYDTGTKRILEVGCGIGLPSLLLNSKHADITATDHHPEVEAFLLKNTSLNDGTLIAFERTDWADNDDQLGKFDLIIGSDLLYEDEHTHLLANFINTHSRPDCEVILSDPGRGRKTKLIKVMQTFGFVDSAVKIPCAAHEGNPYKGHILKFERKISGPVAGEADHHLKQ